MGNMQGRPPLYAESRQISVLVSAEDYNQLAELVERGRIEQRPGFSFGDVLRQFIHRGLKESPRRRRGPLDDPKENTVRRLHAIARTAQKLAREIEAKEPTA
jgi:hypothetical protein